MGNTVFLGDNQEAEHESGASRMCNSIVCAICVAPLLLVAGCVTLGWNERRAVCEMRAILDGKHRMTQVGCDDAASGADDLVMFSCDLSDEGLIPLVPTSSDFESTVSFVGVGLRTVVEVYQCVQEESRTTTKDAFGGKTQVVTYNYSTEWSSRYIDSGRFSSTGKNSNSFSSNCGVENPVWPSSVPKPGNRWNPSAKIGAFTIPLEFLQRIELKAPLVDAVAPTGWTDNGSYYHTTMTGYESQAHGIGRVRVSFYGNDWSKPTYTVLGKNNGGTIARWTASNNWLCSGFTLGDLRAGSLTDDALFEALEAEGNAITYVLRLVGFFILWFAFSRFFMPLEIGADCIPCVGPCLGDGIETIACCVSCVPGFACALGIIGVVWVAMRPLVGIPLMLIFFGTIAGFAAFKIHRRRQKKAHADNFDPVVTS